MSKYALCNSCLMLRKSLQSSIGHPSESRRQRQPLRDLMKLGRPTKYTQDLGDIICEGVSRKTPLAKVCDSNEGMPEVRTVYRWLRTYPDFCQNYERAKEDQADFLVEEALEISDRDDLDPADKRIRVDTRKWIASKFKAKKYGDKITQEHQGPDGGPVQVQEIIFNPVGNDES